MQLFRHYRGWTKILVMALVLTIAMVPVSCAEEQYIPGDIVGIRDPQTPIVVPAGKPIIIGVSTALTGPVESRGMERRDAVVVGLELWQAANGDLIGGHDIMVYAEDDGAYEGDIAEYAAERLIKKEGLVGVIGPQASAGSDAAIPVFADAGVVAISGTATATYLTLTQPEPKFFFRTAYTNAVQGELQARYLISELDASTIWIIDDGESYGMDLADAAQDALEESGRQVTRQSIVTGTVDFSGLTQQIAAADPDAVIFAGFNPEGALFCRQLRDAGYTGTYVSGDAVASTRNFIIPLGEQAEGAVFTGCMPTLPEDYIADYVRINGHEPDTAFAAHVSDAAYILLDAVKKVATEQGDGSLVIDPLELRDAVSNPNLLVGISGIIAFDENGDRVGSSADIGLYIGKVENGEFVLLSM